MVKVPCAVSALHSSCSDMHEWAELAESLYEEESAHLRLQRVAPISSFVSERAWAFRATR